MDVININYNSYGVTGNWFTFTENSTFWTSDTINDTRYYGVNMTY